MTTAQQRGNAYKAEYEAETIPGIESVAIAELSRRLESTVGGSRQIRPGFVRFQYGGKPETLSELRSVVAIYRIHNFDIPRPKAWLGHQHFNRLVGLLRQAAASFDRAPASIGIGAAGSQSRVLRRLLLQLSEALAIKPAHDGKGELFLRLLRPKDRPGWELLVRTTGKPLSKRSYRCLDLPGAVNATVAYAMTQCGALPAKACVVNLCSGSSTILIEHASIRPTDRLLAVENNMRMLDIGRQNTRAAGLNASLCHLQADARHVPLTANSVDRLYADLPFGHHIGSHDENLKLYPAILQEAQRLAHRQTDFVILTHEVKLLKRCISKTDWRIAYETKINLRGLHPRLFVLNRNSTTIRKS